MFRQDFLELVKILEKSYNPDFPLEFENTEGISIYKRVGYSAALPFIDKHCSAKKGTKSILLPKDHYDLIEKVGILARNMITEEESFFFIKSGSMSIDIYVGKSRLNMNNRIQKVMTFELYSIKNPILYWFYKTFRMSKN